MIYTEEDLKQAYAIGYNEAVDDVNEYIDQESTEFSLDESYDDDYSAVEDMICNETKSWRKKEHDAVANRRFDYIDKKIGNGADRNDKYWRLPDKERFDYDALDAAQRNRLALTKNKKSYMTTYRHLKISQDDRLNEEPTERQKRIKELKKRITK